MSPGAAALSIPLILILILILQMPLTPNGQYRTYEMMSPRAKAKWNQFIRLLKDPYDKVWKDCCCNNDNTDNSIAENQGKQWYNA